MMEKNKKVVDGGGDRDHIVAVRMSKLTVTTKERFILFKVE